MARNMINITMLHRDTIKGRSELLTEIRTAAMIRDPDALFSIHMGMIREQVVIFPCCQWRLYIRTYMVHTFAQNCIL